MQSPGCSRLTIKPSSRAFGKGLAVRAAILLPLSATTGLGLQDSDLPRWAIWTVLGSGVLVGALAIATMVTMVCVDGSDVVVRRLIGAEKRVPMGTVTKVVLVQQYEQLGNSIAPTFAAVAGGAKPFVRLSGQVYDPADLMTLTRALGWADVITEPLTPHLLEKRHPGLVPLFERRPWTIAWIVIGVAVVMGVIAGIAAES
jgi:hypothetical protein